MIKRDIFTSSLCLAFILVVTVLLSSGVAATGVREDKSVLNKYDVNRSIKDTKRMIAVTPSQEAFAESEGCLLIKDNKRFKVYGCESGKGIAKSKKSVGLYDDAVIFANDLKSIDSADGENMYSLGFNGSGVRVAVLDSGVNYNHTDLSSSYVGGYDVLNNDNDPLDDNGHGSHVAGIIVSDGILNSTARGIAPEAELVSLKILNVNSSGVLSDAAEAIYLAVDNYSADIISMSFGTNSTYTGYCDAYFPYFTAAVEYANSHGVNVVVSAGNQGFDSASAPACIDSVFSVGVTDNSLNVLTSSNYGSAVDIYSPGKNVFSTWLQQDYVLRSGTSMSAPLVAGTMALMLQKDPSISYLDMQNILLNTSTIKLFRSTRYAKVLNISNAMDSVHANTICVDPQFSYEFYFDPEIDRQPIKYRLTWNSQSGCYYNLIVGDDETLSNPMTFNLGNFSEGNGSTYSPIFYFPYLENRDYFKLRYSNSSKIVRGTDLVLYN